MKESTDQLITRLGAGLQPSPPRILDRQLATALGVGAAAALVLMTLSLGLRENLATALAEPMLWTKVGYAMLLSAGGYVLCQQAARPAARPGWRITTILLPVLLAVMAGLLRIASIPAEARRDEWLGETAGICPWLIALLALPCMLALCFVMRRAAPTRLRWAGFCAGLLAGAISMLVYALHCPEQGIAFVSTWYTLGMCVPAAVGAVAGPRLMRW